MRPLRAWRAWVALLGHREPATALALFRLAIGLCVLLTLGSVGWAGLVEVAWVDRAHGGYRTLGEGDWLVSAFGGPTPQVIWPLFWTGMALGALVAAGLGGRLAALACLLVTQALVDVNGHAGGSYDALLTNALWLLVLAPSTATLSVDCRLRTGRWRDDTPVAAWPRYLVIFQLLLMYSTTGLQKVSAHWVPGGDFSALYYILQQPTWHRFDMTWVAWVYPLTQVATAVTWFWEVGALLLLLAYWYRATPDRPGRLRALCNRHDPRVGFAAVGLVLHLTVMALMDVGPFTPITLAFYLCLWRPDELERAWARLSGRGPAAPVAEAA